MLGSQSYLHRIRVVLRGAAPLQAEQVLRRLCIATLRRTAYTTAPAARDPAATPAPPLAMAAHNDDRVETPCCTLVKYTVHTVGLQVVCISDASRCAS